MIPPVLRAALLPALLALCSGCISVSVDSPAFKEHRAAKARPHKFKVVSIDAEGGSRGVGGLTGAAPDESENFAETLNKSLAEIRPDLYDAKEGIPIAVRLSSFSAPGGGMINPPLAMLFYDWNESSGKVAVKIYEEDGLTGSRGSSEAKITTRFGLLPFALIPGNRKDRPTWRALGKSGFGTAISRFGTEALPRMYASALAEALDSLSDEKVETLSRSVPLTRTEATRRRIREARGIETIHLTDPGEAETAPVVVAHKYRLTESEAKPSHPLVVDQDYSSTTHVGHVKVDTTGFSDEESDDWILRRLIPRICETKAKVMAFEDLPDADATYSVLDDKKDGSNVRTVRFRQTQ